jgi:hypothetical protein
MGNVLPKGAKNSGWRQSSFDGLKPKIFDMGLTPRFHMSSKVVISGTYPADRFWGGE